MMQDTVHVVQRVCWGCYWALSLAWKALETIDENELLALLHTANCKPLLRALDPEIVCVVVWPVGCSI